VSNKITITDIARELNITPATVSRALNNHPAISNFTKQAVQQTAEKLNYNRNRIASSLRSGKTHLLGIIIPSAEIKFFGSVVHGIESIANENGYNVVIYQSNEEWAQEVKGVETLISARVDGILVSIAKGSVDYSHFKEVKDRGIPLVLFDRGNDELGVSSVVINDFMGGYYAVEHLIKQGYKRIAHVSGPQHVKIFSDRMKGYMHALQSNNLPVDCQLIYSGEVSIESGKRAISYFLDLPEPPDAVFAVEDFTALGVIKELKERNIKIPEAFGVVGFANEMFGEYITPELSTVDQQTILMGKESVKLLIDLIDKKRMGNYHCEQQKVVLEPVPVFRKSSCRL
jgi:LacI family transcriptional regulator, galactose operon repressor